MRIDLHNHTILCNHAEGTIEEYVQRAIELGIDEFVEDFKAQAPIWKYDIINKQRVYAKDRSTAISGAGILL